MRLPPPTDVDLPKNNSFNFRNWWCLEALERERDLDLDHLGVDGAECALHLLHDGNLARRCNVAGDAPALRLRLTPHHENPHLFLVISALVPTQCA